MPIPVFMFHGIKSASHLEGADAFYAVTDEHYQYFINLSVQKKIPIRSLEDILANPEEKQSCSFTFDDGHVSNFEAALALNKHGYSADFFVNSTTINTPNFLSSTQLKEMVDMGMSIQSHGHSHVFMNDLANHELLEQLQRSKELIGKACGKEVTIFAPPGGRYDERLIAFAKESGYLAISNSEPGYLNRNKMNSYSIPRVAITSATSKGLYEQLLLCESSPIRKDQMKYFVTKQAKRVLGNRRYEMVWKLLRG